MSKRGRVEQAPPDNAAGSLEITLIWIASRARNVIVAGVGLVLLVAIWRAPAPVAWPEWSAQS